jgi:hypothetical protein
MDLNNFTSSLLRSISEGGSITLMIFLIYINFLWFKKFGFGYISIDYKLIFTNGILIYFIFKPIFAKTKIQSVRNLKDKKRNTYILNDVKLSLIYYRKNKRYQFIIIILISITTGIIWNLIGYIKGSRWVSNNENGSNNKVCNYIKLYVFKTKAY